MTPKHLLMILAGWTFALSAAAQWQWIGKDGRKVFSDRPPPADIQDKDILKQPGGKVRPVAPVEGAEGSVAAMPAGGKADPNMPKISGKDTELQAKKKKLEEEEAAKKKAEEEKIAKAKADTCERAQKALASLQTGARIAATNAKGEREIMDESARATESKRLQGIVDSDCK